MPAAIRSRRPIALGLTVLAAVAVVAAYLAFTAGPARAKQFATLRILEGSVEVRTGEGAFATGTDGQTLRQGNTLRTPPDGRAEIEYFDGSTTRLDHGTEFTLEELESVTGRPQSRRIRGAQGSGRTLNRIAKVTDSQSRFDVETPTAVASVRGTTHADRVYPDGSSEFWVLDGSVLLVFPDGTTLLLRAGEGVLVSAEGVPGEIFDISDLLLEELCGLDEEFCEEEVLGEQIENTDPQPAGPPSAPGPTGTSSGTGTGTAGTADGNGDGGGGPAPPPPGTPPDTRAPLTTIDSGPSGATDTSTATFSFHADEEGATFACTLDDHAAIPCSSPALFPSLADGDHHFSVTATDPAGNTGPAATHAWIVEAREPDTVIDSGPAVVVEETTAVFHFHANEPSTFECSLDGSAFVTCVDGETYTGLANLPHTLQVRAVDVSGKKDSTPAVWAWRIGNPNAITITLTWSAGPRDLDLHVLTPGGEVAYSNPCLSDGENDCWATLDHDITTGPPGSETVTISRTAPGFTSGSFTVFVVNYACDAPFDGSTATVTILAGTTIQSFTAASAAGTGDEKQWNVAGFTVSEGGSVAISGTQTYSGSPNCGTQEVFLAGRGVRSETSIGETEVGSVRDTTLPTPGAQQVGSIAAEVRDDGVHVDWSPDIAGEVRVSETAFPASSASGHAGCEGDGECLITGAEPGARLYLTVLTGEGEVTPAEGVNALTIEIPAEPEPEGAEPGEPQPPAPPPGEETVVEEPPSEEPPADEAQGPPAPEGTQPEDAEPPPGPEPAA